MRNRHSAEGLGAQFQVYSRMTFHDDFAMLQQYLRLLTFQGNSICFNKEQLWRRSHSFCPLKPLVKEYPSPRALDFKAPGLIQKKSTPSIVVSLACTLYNLGHIDSDFAMTSKNIKKHSHLSLGARALKCCTLCKRSHFWMVKCIIKLSGLISHPAL